MPLSHDRPMEGKITLVAGWSIAVSSGDEDEPRVRDLDLAEHLNYERPRDLRKLIDRLDEAGKLGEIRVCATVAQTSGGRPGREYWLTESQALKVVAKSETPAADALLDEVIRVFMLARRGLLASPPAPAALPGRPLLLERLGGELAAALAEGDDEAARAIHTALGALLPPLPATLAAPSPRRLPAPRPTPETFQARVLAVVSSASGLHHAELRNAVVGRRQDVDAAIDALVIAGRIVRTRVLRGFAYSLPIVAEEGGAQ